MSISNQSLNAISPLDGRYQGKLKELSLVFSESALMKYRLQIEAEYLIALSMEETVIEVRRFNEEEIRFIRSAYLNFNEDGASRVKEIEKEINHDVKSIEYFLKEKLDGFESLKQYKEFIHFALTSEDTSNIAYTLMFRQGVQIYLERLDELVLELKLLSMRYKGIAMLSLTHGQPATPTTLGKEFCVFYFRLNKQMNILKKIDLLGKFNGASGNWNAQLSAYPQTDWMNFSKKFVESFELKFNPAVTQIESHDSLAEAYHAVARTNSILRDLDVDMWLYISRGVLLQKKVEGEVGSSTMPHKVNPIDFENSEGNTGLANAMLFHLGDKLLSSRMQRDLTDSTVIRNQGVALGYSLLAIKSTFKGLGKVAANEEYVKAELDDHWEILAEPIQVILRKFGFQKPYEALKKLTRGEKVTQRTIREFVSNLDITEEQKHELLQLTPEMYTGLAQKAVETICQD